MIFYDNIQLADNDQNRYKMSRIVSNAVDFERETKIVFDDRVLHNMKIFINKKKDVTISTSRKKIFISTKKESNRFFKKKTLLKSLSAKINNNFLKNRKIRNVKNCHKRRTI